MKPTLSSVLNRRMNWRDPPATDPLLHMLIPFGGSAQPCRLEIDKLPDGRYRVMAGALLEALELCRTPDLEPLLRHTYRLGASRSVREVLAALQQLQQLSELDGGRPDAGGRAVSRPAQSSARHRKRDCSGVATDVIGRRFWPVKLRPGGRLAQWL